MRKINEVKRVIMKDIMAEANKKEKAMIFGAAALIGFGSIAFYAMIIKVLFNIIF